MRTAVPVLLCAALSLSALAPGGAGRALAARPAEGNKAGGARALIERGLAALGARDFPTAQGLFSDAYRLSPRPELLHLLGKVAAAQGHPVEALDLFRRYLADPAREPDDAAVAEAEGYVNQQSGPRAPETGTGTVSVLSDPGALLLCDGRIAGTLPLQLPLLLAPGAHTLTLELPGKKLEAPLQIEAGRYVEVRFSRASGAVLVSVLPPILLVTESTGTPEAARPLAEALEQAARGEQHAILRAEQVARPATDGADCLARDPCRRQLALRQKADLVLVQRLRIQPGAPRPSFRIELVLSRPEITAPAAEAALGCDACTPEQASRKLREAAARLFAEGLQRPHGTLEVTTVPAAATVHLGESARPAPLHEALWAGSYPLRTTHPRHRPDERTVEVVDGQATAVAVELEPLGGARRRDGSGATERLPRPRWRLALGGTMIGAGVILGGLGLLGIATNGRCATQPATEGGTCEKLYNTLAPGSFSALSGVLLIGSGAVLIALPEKRRR